MKFRFLAALCAPLFLLAACGDDDNGDTPGGGSKLPESMTSVEFKGALPYLDFYAADPKPAILQHETDALRTYSVGEVDGLNMIFSSATGSISKIRYSFCNSRQFDEVELRGRAADDVWNKEFVKVLTAEGYEVTSVSEDRVELLSRAHKVKAEIVRANDAGIAVAYFTPSEKLPELPAFSVTLIHPFHTFGATLEEIKAAENAAGRTLYRVDGDDKLFRSLGPEDSIFNVFGFRLDEEGKLYYVMSVLRDGDYLDTEEFKAAMAADGFIFERREGSYSYFRDAANTVVVRSANMAPNPTIEYIEPDSEQL